MALPKLPSLWDLLHSENPYEEILKLPAPLIAALKERVLRVDQALGGALNLPTTPIEMAIRHPRWKWMDTRHLHYLGQEVAACVESSEGTIVCMPPRHGKSTTLSAWTPFWALARNPELPILMISYEHTFARRWGLKARGLVETYGQEYNLSLNPRQTAAENWELTSGGGMQTTGAGGGISGKAAKLLIVDDAIKDDAEARSQTLRDNIWDWWESTVVARIEPDTAVFVIGTRWHEDDLIGRLISHSRAGDGINFNVVSLAALAEKDDPLGRSPEEGLWLEKFSQDWYEKRKNDVSAYTWSAVYQQRPSPPGGNMVDPEWWRFYRLSELPTEFDQIIQTWDLALDSKKDTDSYQVGLVLGRKGALVFVLAIFREHCGFDDVVRGANRLLALYPKGKIKLVERAVTGPALVATLRHTSGGAIEWPPKGTRKGSKEACLDAIVPDIRSGNVLLPMNPDGTKPKWVNEFIEELRQFPRAPHNDQVDALSQGVAFLLPSARRSVRDAHDEALAEKAAQSPSAAHNDLLHRLVKNLGSRKIDAMKKIESRQNRSVIPFGRIPTSRIPGKEGLARRSGRRMW